MFYEELFTALNDRGIRYLVVGGVAVALHGAVRMTADLDLVIGLDSKNVERFLELMRDRGYRPKVPVPMEEFSDPARRRSWALEKGMVVFAWHHPQRLDELIDVFIEEPPDFGEIFARRDLIRSGKTEISVMSVEDLVAMKEKIGRPQDIEDARALRRLGENG